MLGDFITSILVMILGYAYPAFECFKTVEKNRADIEQLRFWCQYWIIVAILTIYERTGELFVSWLPMYGEMKLALFIYLWYPKSKGTSYVYETFLRPYVAQHETEIDQKLLALRTRAWDIALLYWQNFASQGQLMCYQFLQFLANQSSRNTQNGNLQNEEAQKQQSASQWQPQPPSTVKYSVMSQTTKANRVFQTPSETIATVAEFRNETEPAVAVADASDHAQESKIEETLRAARGKLRRAHSPE